MHLSSGTTGNPVVNPFTRADVEQWGTVMARCYAAAGVGARDVIQITPSFGLFTGGFGFHYGAERIGAMVMPIGAGRTSLQLQLMRDLGTTVLAGIATYPLRILEVAREEGFDLGALRLRVAILGAEIWSDDLRRLIERELSVTTFDILGMTETGGPGLGIDCAARAGIHVWEDDYLCEVVDPRPDAARADGGGRAGGHHAHPRGAAADPLPHPRPHPGGEPGAVRVRAQPPAPGPAARPHRRHGDLPGVNFYPRQIESLLLRQPGVGHEYQIVLDRAPGGSDRLALLVEAREGFAETGLPRLRRELREVLNLSPEITLLAQGALPRPPGKAVRVVDRRQVVE